MQQFVVRDGSRVLSAEYPDSEDGAFLEGLVGERFMEEVSVTGESWERVQDCMEGQDFHGAITLLHGLCRQHPNNFPITFTTGEVMQALGMFYVSSQVFNAAYGLASHDAIRLQASNHEFSSWLLLGDEYLGRKDGVHASVAYMNAMRAFVKGDRLVYAATPSEACVRESSHASLYCSLVELGAEHDSLAIRRRVQDNLVNARMAYEVGLLVRKYYGFRCDEGVAHRLAGLEARMVAHQ